MEIYENPSKGIRDTSAGEARAFEGARVGESVLRVTGCPPHRLAHRPQPPLRQPPRLPRPPDTLPHPAACYATVSTSLPKWVASSMRVRAWRAWDQGKFSDRSRRAFRALRIRSRIRQPATPR